MYTALVLNQASHERLISQFKDLIPAGYEIFCHHMTCNMGDFNSGPLKGSAFKLGDIEALSVCAYSYDDKVMAVKVITSVPSINTTKHITVAVNKQGGGKPFMSNKLTEWQPTSPLQLSGTIEEIQ